MSKLNRVVYDHTGEWYENSNVMLARWGIKRDTFLERIKNKWGVELALTTPQDYKGQGVPCKDHLGNSYSSQKERANFYNQRPDTVKARLSRGWTLKDALTTPVKQ